MRQDADTFVRPSSGDAEAEEAATAEADKSSEGGFDPKVAMNQRRQRRLVSAVQSRESRWLILQSRVKQRA